MVQKNLAVLELSLNVSRFETAYTMKESEVAQSCPTLCDPVDCSPPGSSVHGILQARILEWVAISFSRGSSWPRDQTWVSHIAGRHIAIWATREAIKSYLKKQEKHQIDNLNFYLKKLEKEEQKNPQN